MITVEEVTEYTKQVITVEKITRIFTCNKCGTKAEESEPAVNRYGNTVSHRAINQSQLELPQVGCTSAQMFVVELCHPCRRELKELMKPYVSKYNEEYKGY